MEEEIEMRWVVDINEKLQKMDSSKEVDHWKKRSIYRVPASVVDLHRKAYKPQTVSFGPYHHGDEQLRRMEDHKKRAVFHFLKRSNKLADAYVKALQEVVRELMESYDGLEPSWQADESRFLHLMLVDGCFLLEVMRAATAISNDYAFNDPVFSYHGQLHIIPYIRRDMLMLENQLPMLLLEVLLAVETGKAKENEEFLNKMITKFCNPDIQQFENMGPCLHVLDVYRKSLLQEPRKKKKKSSGADRENPATVPRERSSRSSSCGCIEDIIRSATELHEAGVRFKTSKTKSLKDISFHGGVLSLPMIVVDDTTESTFLNLMAFERLHVGAGNEVTSYIFFMDNIIDSSKDVSRLHSRGIIQNAIGSDKAVAKLFNQLSKDVTLDPESSLHKVHAKVNVYCRKRCNEWRANLIHTYFRSPWAIISLLAAVLLVALTIAQTVYTIYPTYQKDNDACPSSATPSNISSLPPPLTPSPPPPSPPPPPPRSRHH